MSRLSTKQRRAQRFRRAVVRGMVADYRGRWSLAAGEFHPCASRLRGQGWVRETNRYSWRRP